VTLVYWVGWIKMKLGMEVGLGPGHIVLDGDPVPPRKAAPTFVVYALLPYIPRPMSIMAKRSPISAAAEHLLHSSRVTDG